MTPDVPTYVSGAPQFPPPLVHRLPDGGQCFELQPRCSLTPASARVFVGVFSATTLGVGVTFAAQGFWPVLPFAGLEVVVLIWALSLSMRAGTVREFITVTDESITIEHREAKRDARTVFSRHWARVRLHAPLVALHPNRLVIESHGRGCEIGRFLTEDERHALALRLKLLVGNVNESPALR
jgi:uncharacterized membrane protein